MNILIYVETFLMLEYHKEKYVGSEEEIVQNMLSKKMYIVYSSKKIPVLY